MSVKVERPSTLLVSFLKIHHLGLMKLFNDELLLVSLTLAGFIHSKKSPCKKKLWSHFLFKSLEFFISSLDQFSIEKNKTSI